MAGKARRAASRQGQLRRKKQTKGPSGVPPTAPRETVPQSDEAAQVPNNASGANVDTKTPETREPVASPIVSRSTSNRTPRGESTSHGQGRLRGERPAAYLYVGAEFRRILALTGGVLSALIVLGIVL